LEITKILVSVELIAIQEVRSTEGKRPWIIHYGEKFSMKHDCI